jgi:flagellar motor switch/type III secretory pathway protein FliN
MALFDRTIIEQVIAACQAGLSSAAAAIARALGESVQVLEPKAESFDIAGLPAECRDAGLVLAVQVEGEWALILLPQASGLVPGWCEKPDAAAKDQLVALAVELGTLFIPQPLTVTQGVAGYVGDLETALRRAGLSEETARVALQVRSGDKSGIISLVWPASHADVALNESSSVQSSHLDSASLADSTAAPQVSGMALATGGTTVGDALPGASALPLEETSAAAKRQIQYKDVEDGILQLPSYSRSLLKIKVPVMVTLAESKQPVENVLAIGPGSIIHFNKPCEDSLALEIDGQKVALGEAVKVGDKFGLWITSMILPEERFWVLSNRPQIERAK